MTEDVTLLPTQGVSMEKQRLILRAYASLSRRGEESIHYLEVVKRGRLGRTQVCGVNLFFVGLGLLLEVDKGTYRPTKAAIEFLGNDLNNQNYAAIVPTLKSSHLFQFVQEQVAIHEDITYNELVDDLLRESNTSEAYRAKRALDWLILSNLIEIDDDDRVIIVDIG